ncbi:hypothetical protein [Spiroplasma endosymbiont of Atherix ibis]|uniref:hypothetical protein n=1 Tax=Spiroplasma endosymbiont of Atherix ibis TaxID=3066291 RepID=UPI0030CD2A73
MKKPEFYYANYDKNGDLIGVYDSVQEAIKRVWGISIGEKRYKICRNSIHNSIYTGRSIKGIWYKFPIDY